MASAEFTINGSATAGGVSVTASTTVNLALSSSTGVNTVAWSFTGRHSSSASLPTITNGDTKGLTASFPAGATPESWLLQCVVNGALDEYGNYDANLVSTALVGVALLDGTLKFASSETTERGIVGWAEPVNALLKKNQVVDLYPDPDTSDDTAAFKAVIEDALGLARGTLDTATGDTTQNPSGRRHYIVRLQRSYTLTAPIYLRYHRIQIEGATSHLHGGIGYEGPRLTVAHSGACFVIDMGASSEYAGAGHIALRGFRIERSAGEYRSGPAILIQGAAWSDGLALDGMWIDQHSAGVEIDSGYVEDAFARLQIHGCMFRDCDTPIETNGHTLTLMSIRDSTMTANDTGAYLPTVCGTIDQLDIEAQADGLTIAPVSRDFDVRSIWSESNTGDASVMLDQAVNGTIGKIHNATALPDVELKSCRTIRTPLNSAQLVNCADCEVRGFMLTDATSETIGAATVDLQSSVPLARLADPPFTGTVYTDANWDTPTYFGDVQLNANEVGSEGFEESGVTVTITHAVADGDNCIAAFAVRHVNAVTDNRCTVKVEFHESGGDWQTAQTRTVVLTDSTLPAGRTVQCLAIAKCEVTADQVRVTAYPYGFTTSTGWGALLSPIAVADVDRADLVPQFHVPTWLNSL